MAWKFLAFTDLRGSRATIKLQANQLDLENNLSVKRSTEQVESRTKKASRVKKLCYLFSFFTTAQ